MDKKVIKIDCNYLDKILKEMVKINSVLGQESNLAHFLAEECQNLGMKTVFDEVATRRENLYASYSFEQKGKTLTFNGHSDTVEVCEGWTNDPFTPIEKDDKLIGLGVIDMKGGLACQLAAIKSLIETDENSQGTIHFCATVDEEGYGSGAKKMLTNELFGKGRTEGIIISEPFTGLSSKSPLPLGMSGKVLYKITFHGRSAHAFTPEQGINAINDAAKLSSALETIGKNPNEHENIFHLPYDEDFGYGSFCPLKISGGYKTYSVVVPEECELIVNRLILPKETKESVYNDIKKLIDSLALESKVIIEIIPPFYYSYKIARENKLQVALEQSFVEVIKQKPITGYIKMITDANIFTGEGDIPTVHFGPTGGNLHAADEYIVKSSMEVAAQVYYRLYLNFQKKSKLND